jgi:hypothetical protein
MKTLDVEPPVLVEVEDFAEFMVDFPVAMRPNACLVKPKQGMHSCPEKMCTIFFSKEIQKSCHGVLHGFFEEQGRFERSVSLYFHDVQLEFFSKGEARQLNEVYDSSAEVFYDFIHDRQSLQFLVDERKLVLWTQDL